jgi:hypothetical protein
MTPVLTDLGRRVLAHLPVWSANEKQLIKDEGGADVSVRSYTLPEFTERLAEDASLNPPLTEAAVLESLAGLQAAGLASVDGEDWRMTQLGYEALVAPVEEEAQNPGAVVVDLNPAVQEGSLA